MKIKKNENGDIAINDYMLAVTVFIIGTFFVTFMYQRIYKLSSKVKADEAVIGYVTEICEQIDLEKYSNVSTVEGVENVINKTLANTPVQNVVTIKCTKIEKYSDESTLTNVSDCVEKIHISVQYTSLNDNARDYEISKLKVKEL